MFIAESFTIADSCTKIVKRLSVEKMNKENVVCACTRARTHTHTRILFGIKKEGDSDTGDIMNEPRGHYVKGKTSARE